MDNDQRPTAPRPPDSRSTAPRADDPAEIPWARTTTGPPVGAAAQPAAPVGAGQEWYAAPSGSAPAVAPPVWSGRKTAVAAALAIGFASVGAVGAAAVLPAMSQTGQGGSGLPGGAPAPQLQNQQGVPSGQSQGGTRHFGGGRVPGVPGDDDGGDDDDGSSS